MKIWNFEDFIFESDLTNMPFYMSGKLLEVLEKIEHPISTELITYHKKREMLKYTMMDTELDGTEYVSFIPSDKLRSTTYNTFDDISALRLRILNYPIQTTSHLWNKYRIKIKIGRLVKALFPKYGDKQIEEFVHTFKSVNTTEKPIFRIISKSDIGINYQSSSYTSMHGRQNPLWNSCMNDKDFFDIYIFNPRVCKMLVLIDNDVDYETGEVTEKISGRALLWNTNQGWFMDRVYYTKDFQYFHFIQWAKKMKYLYKSENKSGKTDVMKDGKSIILSMEVKLEDKIESYSPLPYFDTFIYGYDTNEGDSIISNTYPTIQTIRSLKAGENRIIYKLTDEEGGFYTI